MKLLENKVAIVTGASRGIGRSIALGFAQAGAHVAFTYLNSESKALELEKELSTFGVQAKSYRSDASKVAEADALTENVVKDFGKIDVLVNNAGVTRDNLLIRMSEEQWDEVINTNLKSIFALSKGVAKVMMRQRSGSIINISSIVGIIGQAGQANYSASKAGIIGFSKSLADEMGSRSIRCNVIAPGFIQTEMTDALADETQKLYLSRIPMNRFGQADEVAKVALFLASDMSSYVSGQVISVCGALCR